MVRTLGHLFWLASMRRETHVANHFHSSMLRPQIGDILFSLYIIS